MWNYNYAACAFPPTCVAIACFGLAGTPLWVYAPKISYLEALHRHPLAWTNWNSLFSFSGKCEHNCLELTWHPYGESKPCDPDSLFSVVKSLFKPKKGELGWEEINISYWIDLFLCKFQCSCVYFYLCPCKVMRSLVASRQARVKTGDKEQTMKRTLCQKKKAWIAVWRNLRLSFYHNDKWNFCSTGQN